MNTLERVIRNKFLLSKNYKRVYDFVNPLDLTLDELTAFIIYNMECENIIEFIKLVTPFMRYIFSLLKYKDSDLYINDKILVKLELQEFQETRGEYIFGTFKINDENETEPIWEYIEYFNNSGYYLTFTRKFDAYFIICKDSDENDSYNQHINADKTFKTEECLICVENKPNVLFCGCSHLCVCEECIKYYESYQCPICKNINENIRIIV